MSEQIEQQETQEPQQEAQAVSADEYNSLKKENEAIKSKMEQLLGETKKAKAERLAAQEEAARKAGDFEQLFKSSEEKNKQILEEHNNLLSQISQEKVRSESMRIASTLAEGHNAELLAEFVQQRLKYSEGELKVLDNNGQLTVSSIDDLANEFKTNARFSSLVKGPKSTGGGATGSGGASGAAKVKTRAEFDQMNQVDRMAFIKSGGRLSN